MTEKLEKTVTKEKWYKTTTALTIGTGFVAAGLAYTAIKLKEKFYDNAPQDKKDAFVRGAATTGAAAAGATALGLGVYNAMNPNPKPNYAQAQE